VVQETMRDNGSGWSLLVVISAVSSRKCFSMFVVSMFVGQNEVYLDYKKFSFEEPTQLRVESLWKRWLVKQIN